MCVLSTFSEERGKHKEFWQFPFLGKTRVASLRNILIYCTACGTMSKVLKPRSVSLISYSRGVKTFSGWRASGKLQGFKIFFLLFLWKKLLFWHEARHTAQPLTNIFVESSPNVWRNIGKCYAVFILIFKVCFVHRISLYVYFSKTE